MFLIFGKKFTLVFQTPRFSPENQRKIYLNMENPFQPENLAVYHLLNYLFKEKKNSTLLVHFTRKIWTSPSFPPPKKKKTKAVVVCFSFPFLLSFKTIFFILNAEFLPVNSHLFTEKLAAKIFIWSFLRNYFIFFLLVRVTWLSLSLSLYPQVQLNN